MPAADAVTYLTEYQPEASAFRGPDRGGLMTTFKRAAAGEVEWSFDVADDLVARQLWNGDVWASIMGAWRSPALDDDSWARVVQILDKNPAIGEADARATASFLEEAVDRKDIAIADLELLEQVGERLLPMSDAEPAGVHRSGGSTDWLASAINHPAGQVALAWSRALAKRMEMAGEEWQEIPELLRTRFEALLGGAGANGELARVVFASQVHFLFSADRPWTEAHVIPLFDWDADPVRAAQAWDGFLVWGLWNDPLFDRMQPYVRQTFRRMADLGDKQKRFGSALASVAAFSVTDPVHGEGWLFYFMQSVDAEHRANWAGEFGRYIESVSAEGAEALWTRWLSDYWTARITGVPRPLEDVEKGAMVGWVPALRPQFAEAVDRVLEAPPETLDHFTFYRLRKSGVPKSNGRDTGRLLRGLMANLNTMLYDSDEVLELATLALGHGAEPNDLLAVADDMARLGCHGAEQLRSLATGGGH